MSEPKLWRLTWEFPNRHGCTRAAGWFCNWIERQVVAVSLDGKAEVMTTRDPTASRWVIPSTRLPDGTLR